MAGSGGDPGVVGVPIGSFCPRLLKLDAARFAPRTANGKWRADFAVATRYSEAILLGGDETFVGAGTELKRSASGYDLSPACAGDGPFAWIGVEDDVQATWSRGALASSGSVRTSGVDGSWPVDGDYPAAALSGHTLVMGTSAVAVENDAWGDVFGLTWQSARFQSLRGDRFALFDGDETRIVKRVDHDWSTLAHLPPAKAAAMTDPTLSEQLIALSDDQGTSLYQSEGADWSLVHGFSAGAAPSLGSLLDQPVLGLIEADGAHLYGPEAEWSETDAIPGASVVLVRRDRVAVLIEDPVYLAAIPVDAADAPLTNLLVIYEPSH